jgi:tRNA 2-thiouridine synthesizing protein A
MRDEAPGRPRLKALGRRLSEREAVADGAAVELDCIGLNCPMPVLKARKALAGMRRGDRLVLVATDPMSAVDIPHLCAQDGHRLRRQESAGGRYIFEIECG